MRAPTSIRFEVIHQDGRSETFERDGALGEYMICRQTIGQIASEQNIVIDDPRISRRHCSLLWNGNSDWLLQDLGSTNGTNVNDQSVLEEMVLKNGTEIRVGDSAVRVQFGPLSNQDWQRPGAASQARGDSDAQTLINMPSGDSAAAAAKVPQPEADDGTVVNLAAGAEGPAGAAADDGDATVIGMPASPAASNAPATDDDTVVGLPQTRPQAAAEASDATVVGISAQPAAKADASRSRGQGDDTVIGTSAAAMAEDKDLTAPKTAAKAASQGQAARPAAAPTVADGAQAAPAAARRRGLLLAEMQDAGLFNAEQATAIEHQARASGRTVFATIVNDPGLTNQTEIQEWAAQHAGCRHIAIAQELQDAVRAVDWLPLNLAEKSDILLLHGDDDGYVEYATTDPFDVVRRDWVARCERRDSARPVLVLPSVFRDAMKRLRRELNDEDDGEIGVAVEIDWDQAQRMRENLEGQDVPAIVDFILFRAHALGASDIHVEPTEQSLLIRNRVDGILHEEAVLPAALHPEVSSRIKILSGMDVAEKRRPQDGRISINIRQSPIDVRVSSFPTVYGEKLVMRLLDQSSLMPSPNHLGLEPRGLRMLIDGLNAPHGLIMLCGPTGSGKTTTLYSCLGAIDKTSKNVLTVEDPVEYRLEGVHQMQVNHKIGLTFQQGLRNILRQDPDIIMVGECRDVETAEMAIQASLTGHIVFSTIHTNDAVGVVSRLLDMNIDPFLVATAMTLAIAQRLVRTICPECKAQVDGSHIVEKLRTDGVSDAKLKMLGIEIDPDLQYAVGRGRGCNYCRGTGYSGRQAVFEVFEMTNDARQIVMAEQYNADELRDLAERDGLNTLVQSGLELVEQGVTTHEEVIRVLGESS